MISLIIPLWNEEKILPKMLQCLSSLKGSFEVLFVDGGSNDGTAAILAQKQNFPCKVVTGARGRAAQMNEGAAHAQGAVLWFVHCDSRLHPDSLHFIREAFAQGAQAGVFSLFFYDSSRPLLKTVAFFSRMRARVFRSFYGDQGIFVSQSLFRQLGGFPPLPLMEDLEFSKKLKAYPQKIVSCPIGTSARRFLDKGVWKTIFFMQELKLRYKMGVPADVLAARYRRIR